MTALSVQPPFPILTDIDGQPLDDGFIFIGVANLDPIANPITVYWDAALTVTATQPIRTRGGYPMNAGFPARLYVDANYSIAVQNRNGSTVYSSPTPTERFGDLVVITPLLTDIAALRSAIWLGVRPDVIQLIQNYFLGDGGGFFYWDAASTATDDGGIVIKETATATGRWIRQVGDVRASYWGANPSASAAANRIALQAAFNYAIASKQELIIPKMTYTVDQPLLVTGDGLHIKGQGGGGRDDDYIGNSVIQAVTGHGGAMILWGNQAEHVVTGSIKNITLDCAGFATKGLDFVDAQYINGDDVLILNPTLKGVHFRNNFETANPCGWGTWNALKVFCRSVASVNADGIHLDGTGSAGVSMLTFTQPQVQHRNGHGYLIGGPTSGGDGYLFLKPYAFTDGTGDNYRHETTAAYPIGAGTYIHPIGGGPFRVVNNLTAAGTTIRVVDLPTGDGQPLIVGAGRHSVQYDTGDGRKYGRQRLDTALVQFDDDMSFVNYTSPVLRTRSGNFGVTQVGMAALTNHTFIGGGVNLTTSSTSGDEGYICDTDTVGSGGFSVASNPQAMWILSPVFTTLQLIRFGYLNATAGTPNGVYFEHDSAVSANWFCVTRAAGVSTRTDTGIPVAAAKRQFMIQGGEIDGFFFFTRLDATTGWTQVGAHTTNIPGSGVILNLVTGIRTLSAAIRTLLVYHIKHARDVE